MDCGGKRVFSHHEDDCPPFPINLKIAIIEHCLLRQSYSPANSNAGMILSTAAEWPPPRVVTQKMAHLPVIDKLVVVSSAQAASLGVRIYCLDIHASLPRYL